MPTTKEQIDQRELLTLEQYLKQYGQQAEIFAGQLELLENGRMEALAAIDALKGLQESGDGSVLLQVGGGASVRAKVPDPANVLINIGADVIVERPSNDAIGFLEGRITEMEASEKKVAETLERLRAQMNEIAKRIEMGYQQAVAAEQSGIPPSRPSETDEE